MLGKGGRNSHIKGVKELKSNFGTTEGHVLGRKGDIRHSILQVEGNEAIVFGASKNYESVS